MFSNRAPNNLKAEYIFHLFSSFEGKIGKLGNITLDYFE